MTSDLHIHPLARKYRSAHAAGSGEVVLDDEDKKAIRAVVDWCCHVRKLDAVAITDHDVIETSRYAAEHAKTMPIEIVTGAECTVCDPRSRIGADEVHLLCLGIEKLPPYNSRTPVDKMIHGVHTLGGYVIMAHPVRYPQTFFRYINMPGGLDGYEYRSGRMPPFDEGKKYVDSRVFSIQAFNNSDFHYYGHFPMVTSPEIHNNYYEGDVLR